MPELQNILLVGASGRMGSCVRALALEQGIAVQECATRPQVRFPPKQLPEAPVIIDFSGDFVTGQLLEKLLEGPWDLPLVVGTTGLSQNVLEKIEHYSRRAACLVAGNFSPGVALLRACVRLIAGKLPDSWEAEIVEMHHRHKRDRPSGTALSLQQDLREAGPWVPNEAPRDREAEPLIHSLRLGSVVGEHQVIFAGPGEQLRLVHQAEDRSIFARGALRAAGWILKKGPGLYRLEEALGL